LTVRLDGVYLRWRRLHASRPDNGWLLDEHNESVPIGRSGTVRGIERLVSLLRSDASAPGDELSAALAGHEIMFAFVESHFQGGTKVQVPLRRRGIEITGRVGDKFC
jgi:hypothetical protein